MEANDKVVVVSPDGRRLSTERLRYDNASQPDLHRPATSPSTAATSIWKATASAPIPTSGTSSPTARGASRATACCCRDSSESREPGLGAAAAWLAGGRSPGRSTGVRAAAAQSQRCVFQIDNVDRQGSVSRDAPGHQLLRRRQRAGSAAGAPDLDAERQRRGVRRERGAVHRPGEVSRLHPHDGRRPGHLLQESASAGKPGDNVNTRNLTTGSTLTGPSLDYFRVVKGVRDTLEMYATGRPADRIFPDRFRRRQAGALRHRGRSGAIQGRRPDLRRRQGDGRSQRLRLALRFAPARHRRRQRRHPPRRRAGAAGAGRGQLLDHRQPDRPQARPARELDLPAGQGNGARDQQGVGSRGRHHRAST